MAHPLHSDFRAVVSRLIPCDRMTLGVRLLAFAARTVSFVSESSAQLLHQAPGSEDAFGAYFGLKEDLEGLLGRPVDLVMANAVRNPHLAASAANGAEEVYAA